MFDKQNFLTLASEWDKISELIERWDPESCNLQWYSMKTKETKKASTADEAMASTVARGRHNQDSNEKWTPKENRILEEAHAEFGNQWDKISEVD